jgi:hypothetical protein
VKARRWQTCWLKNSQRAAWTDSTVKPSEKKAEKENTQITINVDNMEPYNCPITEEELNQALKSCTGSSTGPDQIHFLIS